MLGFCVTADPPTLQMSFKCVRACVRVCACDCVCACLHFEVWAPFSGTTECQTLEKKSVCVSECSYLLYLTRYRVREIEWGVGEGG